MLRRLKETVASELPQKSERLLPGGLPGWCRQATWSPAARHATGKTNSATWQSSWSSPAVLPSPYQQALFRLMERELRGGSLRGVNNVLMEMRNVCNHPLIRCGTAQGHIWGGGYRGAYGQAKACWLPVRVL